MTKQDCGIQREGGFALKDVLADDARILRNAGGSWYFYSEATSEDEMIPAYPGRDLPLSPDDKNFEEVLGLLRDLVNEDPDAAASMQVTPEFERITVTDETDFDQLARDVVGHVVTCEDAQGIPQPAGPSVGDIIDYNDVWRWKRAVLGGTDGAGDGISFAVRKPEHCLQNLQNLQGAGDLCDICDICGGDQLLRKQDLGWMEDPDRAQASVDRSQAGVGISEGKGMKPRV